MIPKTNKKRKYLRQKYVHDVSFDVSSAFKTERFLTACISLVLEPDTGRDRVKSRRVRTHEKNSGDAVRQLGTIIQSIFCAQSGASIRLTVWKWSGESRYLGAFPPVLENFCRAFSPGATDRPWVSEDGRQLDSTRLNSTQLDLSKALFTI